MTKEVAKAVLNCGNCNHWENRGGRVGKCLCPAEASTEPEGAKAFRSVRKVGAYTEAYIYCGGWERVVKPGTGSDSKGSASGGGNTP